MSLADQVLFAVFVVSAIFLAAFVGYAAALCRRARKPHVPPLPDGVEGTPIGTRHPDYYPLPLSPRIHEPELTDSIDLPVRGRARVPGMQR